jgi:protein phosphatase 1 regulatory subunit 7
MTCPWLEVVNAKEVGKPANYIIKQIRDIREYMREIDMDVDNFTYSDL